MNTEFEKLVTKKQITSALSKISSNDSVSHLVIAQAEQILHQEKFNHLSFYSAQALIDFIWEKLNTGHWSEVDIVWRKLYSIISVIKVLIILDLSDKNDHYNLILRDIVKICDIGLLMGAPVLDNICSKLASFFCHKVQIVENFNDPNRRKIDEIVEPPLKKVKIAYPLSDKYSIISVKESIELSIEQFVTNHKTPQLPVKIKQSIEHWPAIEDKKWNFEYFKNTYGSRTVPIELGKRYTDDSWTQNLMTIQEFIEKYIKNPKNDQSIKAYLAQHELFEQIPELKEDFEVPFYCFTSDIGDDKTSDNSDTLEDNVAVNIWLGPSETVSPLHTDPKHNCLCQVFGEKYVRLYPADQSEFLHPYNSEALLSNTSQIDLEEDFEEIVKKFPKFKEAKGFECILSPGDILYIPPKCWHFVKSLSKSCSLSFWF